MRAILRGPGTVAVALLLAACSGNPPAATGGGGATNQPVSVAPTTALCSEPADGTATDVDATVEGNSWGPVAAKVGEVITWTNADSVPHKVALDDGSCSMSSSITGSEPQSLIFNAAGSYPFHCTIHSGMEGTIVIS